MTAAQLPIHINNCLQASPTADISPRTCGGAGRPMWKPAIPTLPANASAWHGGVVALPPSLPQREPATKNALGASAACSIGDDTPSHELSLSQMSGPGLQACKKTSVVSSQS